MKNLNFEQASWEAFQEAAAEKYDFATCQRQDGSKYGTGGQCRKGTPTTPGSDDDKKKTSSKKSSGGGGKMSDEEKNDLQVKASKGDKAAMKALNDARAAGRIGKESGWDPKSDTPPLRPDGSVDTSAGKSKKGSGSNPVREEQQARKQFNKDMKLKAGEKLTPAQQKERSAKIKAEIDRRKELKGPKRKPLTSADVDRVKAQFDRKRQMERGGQDGPKATAKQKASARKNFQGIINNLENKLESGAKLTQAEQAQLNLARAAVKANS